MSMGDQEEEDFKMALRLSMQQNESPEPKRSKPMETETMSEGVVTPPGEESLEVKNRRLQRELMAAAAEKRMTAAKSAVNVKNVESRKNVEEGKDVEIKGMEAETKSKNVRSKKDEVKSKNLGTLLSEAEATKLFSMIFGDRVSKDVLAQWSNQGIRFSVDTETCMGLVQHEGGPCGVLAAVQAFVLKYLLFFPEDSGSVNVYPDLATRRMSKDDAVTTNIFFRLTEEKKSRALIKSMSEILFLCGSNDRAVIASLDTLDDDLVESIEGSKDEVIAKVLQGTSMECGYDFQKVLRINTCTSQLSAFQKLETMLPVFRSRMGALLFLIAALLSRGLDNVQEDRDDPTQPLVTAPFGHASQEIVNLLLCGSAVANVFDGKMDLGGGMFVKGISTTVEVGFLTLLESLNFCKVGQYLKCPQWPIWVVGSESHYTVLFALDTNVQEENELENRETQIRRAFDSQDQSGGGGFISVEGFHHVIKETNINLPLDKVENLCSAGFIVWSEFWQALLDLDKSLGGVKDSTALMGKKVFDLYHFNGIAKSVGNGQTSHGSENPIQRPRLTKLSVSVPPRWTPEEFLADVPVASDSATKEPGEVQISIEVAKPQPAQHAPLVDCIRTRWPRAVCNWEGDVPSIV